MKKIKIVFFILPFFAITLAQAQTKGSEKKTSPTTIDPTNLLDAQTDLYKNYMGDTLLGGKDPKSINGYLELVEESDLSTDEKKRLKEFYHTSNLSPQKLDSLQTILKKSEQEIPK